MAIPFLISQKFLIDKNPADFNYLVRLLDGKDKMFVTKHSFKQRISELFFKTNLTAKNHLKSPIELESSRIKIERTNKNTVFVFLFAKASKEWLVDACCDRCVGIDIGEKNAISVVSNFSDPFLLNEPFLKQYFDLETPAFTELVDKIFEYMQNYVKANKVETVYLGKITSGMCGCIFRALKNLKGVNVEIIDESDTSQASFLDGDFTNPDLLKLDKFSGERVTRDKYISNEGIIVDADVNASYNIVLKGNQLAFLSCLGRLNLVPTVKTI